MSSLQASSNGLTPFVFPFPTTKTWNNESVRSTYTLAHEVRNPLTTINLSTEMLLSATTDAELRFYLDIIMRGSSQINQLIDQILKYQEVEEIPVGNYSLHQLLDEALTMTADRITLKKIKLRKEYATENDKIFVDKEKVRAAIVDIIVNAVDAMSYKKGELSVVTRSIGKKYAVEIADNGVGISKENLSAALEILQYNHIGVDVSTEEGQGTSFILFIDIAG